MFQATAFGPSRRTSTISGSSQYQPTPTTQPTPKAVKAASGGRSIIRAIKTLVNSAEDMAARAQQLRAHAYAMSGTPLPKHATPPAPVITSIVIGGLIAWRGSAGAVRYSVERIDPGAKEWKTVCDRCATDTDDPWADPHATLFGARYRVT